MESIDARVSSDFNKVVDAFVRRFYMHLKPVRGPQGVELYHLKGVTADHSGGSRRAPDHVFSVLGTHFPDPRVQSTEQWYLKHPAGNNKSTEVLGAIRIRGREVERWGELYGQERIANDLVEANKIIGNERGMYYASPEDIAKIAISLGRLVG